MRYYVIRGTELSKELVRRWAQIQESEPTLASPYFRPEFTHAVASVRDDVWITIMEDAGRIVGFFPFHRKRGGLGRPVGLALSDYHGVIADTDLEWSLPDLLRASNLVRFEFDHLLAGQARHFAAQAVISNSPTVDLASGFDQFVASRDKSGRKLLREIERKREKLCALAPLHHVQHSPEGEVLKTLIDWKSQQCRSTGTVDYFALDWCVGLVERVHASEAVDFGGVLSCLYAGERLAAVHLAMRTQSVWHSWFPSYNRAFSEYSPGLILLLDVIRAGARQNVDCLDFGKGMSMYKRRLMTGTVQVAEGAAELPAFRNRTRDLGRRLEAWGRRSALGPMFRVPGRWLKRVGRQGRYE